MLALAFLALAAPQTARPTTLAQLRLEALDLRAMSQEWGAPQKGLSVDKNPLKIGGRTFQHGVGTHAYSELRVKLVGPLTQFHSKVGMDDEMKAGKGSVRFLVYADGKVVADSGVMRGGNAPKELNALVRGARELRLIVEDAGDGIDSDHADWADATISFVPQRGGVVPKATPLVHGKPIPIAMGIPARTEIHGPRVLGGTPGRDFLFRIPVTGRGPFRYTAKGLPEGLSLDARRGIIVGRMAREGTYRTEIAVRGRQGTDRRVLTIVAGPHKLALTPPMGWNSWNVWGTSVDAQKVRDAAEAFVRSGLADYGYSFINIDDAWEGSRGPDGIIRTNEKFPDMGGLADYVHGHGLKLGIYSSPGPKTCAGYEGSYRYEEQDAKTYAAWGIDYLKHDWCSYGGIVPRPTLEEMQKPYAVMRRALDNSGRDIVYSLCQYGMGDVWKWGKSAVGGNLWRTTGDITDTWASMAGIGFSHSEKAPGAAPGGWNDPDMLVVGHVGWGPSVRPTRLSPNEQITHITLWSLLAAPLIIGCDLTKLDAFTKALLMNHDVIEVDQDPLGKAATRIAKDGAAEVWARPLFDGTYAVGLFNRGIEEVPVRVDWKGLGLRGEQRVRNLWLRKDLGGFRGGYGVKVPGHGAMLVKVGRPR